MGKYEDKECVHCGKMYTPKIHNAKYCSRYCYNRSKHLVKQHHKREKENGKPLSELTDAQRRRLSVSKKDMTRGTALAKQAKHNILMDFAHNGMEVIETVKRDQPGVYLNFIAKILPEEKNINIEHTFMDVLLEAQKKVKVIEDAEFEELH